MARASHYEDDKSRILDSVHTQAVRHGKPPSVRDLADQFDVGVATMHSYLRRLEGEGMVTWRHGAHRTLRLTSAGVDSLAG